MLLLLLCDVYYVDVMPPFLLLFFFSLSLFLFPFSQTLLPIAFCMGRIVMQNRPL